MALKKALDFIICFSTPPYIIQVRQGSILVDFSVIDVKEDIASRMEVVQSQLNSGNVVMNIQGMPVAAYPNSTQLEVGATVS